MRAYMSTRRKTMTNKEAIKILKRSFSITGSFNDNPHRYYEALELAIKALEEHPTDKEIQDDMSRTYLGGKKNDKID